MQHRHNHLACAKIRCECPLSTEAVWEPLFMLRVFGRLPVSGVTRCSEAGVRKASGEETAGEFAPAVVSVYGDLACVCPDLWISNGDHGRVIIVALALVAACRIGTVVL